jgi:hypothetical protein
MPAWTNYAVLVCPARTSATSSSCLTRNFGPLGEGANSTVRSSELRLDPTLRRRLQPDKEGQKLARDNRGGWRRWATVSAPGVFRVPANAQI